MVLLRCQDKPHHPPLPLDLLTKPRAVEVRLYSVFRIILCFFVLKRSFAQGLHLKDDTPIPSASDSHQLAHVVKTVPAMLSSCDPNVAFFLRRLNL